MNKVVLFIDGKNFYSNYRDNPAVADKKIDFNKMADWLVNKVGGSTLMGCHYYSGVEPNSTEDSQRRLVGFLDVLETNRGYFVHRFDRRQHRMSCNHCGHDLTYSQEKEVDTTIVADIVRGAAVNIYDTLILLSGDADFVPAIEAARALGKQAYIASWGGVGISQKLRRVAFDHIDLTDGINNFERTDRPDSSDDHANYNSLPAAELPKNEEEMTQQLLSFVNELRIAEKKFGGGYVGLSFFLQRWRSPSMPIDSIVRREMLDRLVEMKVVEVYSSDDGMLALRTVPETFNGIQGLALPSSNGVQGTAIEKTASKREPEIVRVMGTIGSKEE